MFAKCGKRVARRSQQTRGFFDYLAPLSNTGATTTSSQKSTGYSWEWLTWYQENANEFITNGQLDKFRDYWNGKDAESRGSVRPVNAINWDEWREKIADPTFVDTLRAEYHATVDIENSKRAGLEQVQGWSEEAIREYEQATKDKFREYGLQPPQGWTIPRSAQEAEDRFQVTLKVCEDTDAMWEESRRELVLDYEQVEAERDLFGARGEMMDYGEHPQYAEMHEENSQGTQTYTDKILYEFEYHKFTRRERLLQLQDETSRQIFLDRFKESIKIHGEANSMA